MTRVEATTLVEDAIRRLIENDLPLLDLGVTERALSHQLAHYMSMSEIVRRPLSVDCEYNRHLAQVKKLNLPRRDAIDREVRATTVFPDIVVHERNSDDNNVVVLEVKRPGEEIAYDELKLRAFRDELGYVHAGHVILGRGADNELVRELRWLDD